MIFSVQASNPRRYVCRVIDRLQAIVAQEFCCQDSVQCMRGWWFTDSDLVAGVAPGRCRIHEVAIAGAALHAKMSQVMSLPQSLGSCTAYAVLTSACPALLGSMQSIKKARPMRICAWC